MSWYSDGEPFDEFDPPQCRECERVCTADECHRCWQRMMEMEKEYEKEEEDDLL